VIEKGKVAKMRIKTTFQQTYLCDCVRSWYLKILVPKTINNATRFICIFHDFGPHNLCLSSAYYCQCSRIFWRDCVVPCDWGAGCCSCFGREFQSIGTWSVKDLSVTFRREWTEGRCGVMIFVRGVSCMVRLNIEKAAEIRRLCRLRSFVGDR